MNRKVVLDSVPFEPDIDSLAGTLRIREGARDWDDLMGLIEDAREVARPRGLYKIAFIESFGDDFVVVDGVRLTSRVLRVNLAHTQRVFPYIATCGTELEAWAGSITDMLQRFWADAIKDAALRAAIGAVLDHIDARYQPGATSRMSPGSLEDWPIQEQKGLFAILGDPGADIGVELLDSYLMTPTKTVSRLMFSSEEDFENCRLCPRKGCPSRRVPYEEGLYEKKYRL